LVGASGALVGAGVSVDVGSRSSVGARVSIGTVYIVAMGVEVLTGVHDGGGTSVATPPSRGVGGGDGVLLARLVADASSVAVTDGAMVVVGSSNNTKTVSLIGVGVEAASMGVDA